MFNKYTISFASIAIVLLALLQGSVSYYQNYQAMKYVERIMGVQAGELTPNGVLIEWSDNTDPPACPVRLEFVWDHESGLSIAEFPEIRFDELEHLAISKTKNGKVSNEPFLNETVYEILIKHPGEWHYKILFIFDCTFIDNEWINWIDFSEVHIIKPVVIIIKEDNNVV